jgi:hypothetical protein
MAPPVTTHSVTTAYVRIPHLPDEELEKDHSIYAIVYVYNGNEVKIWRPYVTDDDE